MLCCNINAFTLPVLRVSEGRLPSGNAVLACGRKPVLKSKVEDLNSSLLLACTGVASVER
jgi:hypothetical protein